jgi:hypothetical protein
MFLEKAKNSLKFWSVFFVALVFSSPICWGADDVETPSPRNVTASLIAEEIKTLPSKMDLISEDDVKEYPHSAVLSLASYFKKGMTVNRKTGTGFVIDDHFILTAAHLVFDKGEPAKQIFFHQGRHGATYQLKGSVEKYVYPKQYVDGYLKATQQEVKLTSAMMTHDYALLYVGEDIKFREPIEPIPFSVTIPVPLMFCGYPGKDYNKVEEERMHDLASYPYECEAAFSYHHKEWELLGFQTHSYCGMSGGPIRCSEDDESWQAFAIQSVGAKDKNGNPSLPTAVCCLTEEKLSTIAQWKKDIARSIYTHPKAIAEECIKDPYYDYVEKAIDNLDPYQLGLGFAIGPHLAKVSDEFYRQLGSLPGPSGALPGIASGLRPELESAFDGLSNALFDELEEEEA